MCYNLQQKAYAAYKRARFFGHKGDMEYWKSVLKQFDDWNLAPGFAHPKLAVYADNDPNEVQFSIWGFIPPWAKEPQKIWNSTLNARSETMFEKPSFRQSAKDKRCIVPVDGFYDYHDYKGKKYPFFIERKDGDPFYIAGLWNEWSNKETGEILHTFTLLTTAANKLMAKIHNKPKFSNDPRMPVLLNDELADEWLKPLSKEQIKELCQPFPHSELQAFTVAKLSGKDSPGNTPEASEKKNYPDLVFEEEDDLTLF